MSFFPSDLYNTEPRNNELREWARLPLSPEDYEANVLWIRNRPKAIHALMLRFPPGCLVIANRRLEVPGPGVIGLIQSYTEPSEKNPNGSIRVVDHHETGVAGYCDPDWLEVVEYRDGFSVEDVRRILG